MDFEQLTTLVGDNEEAKTFISTLQTTSNNHVETIGKHETLIGNLKGDLEKFKQGNSLVKSKLGIEQLNEDSLGEALSRLSKNSNNNDEEITNLKSMIDKLNNEKTTLSTEYESKISNVQLDNLIANTTAGAGIQSDEAFNTVKTLLKMGVVVEDGNAVYKDNGKTVFDSNNQPMTLQGKLESIKTNPIYAGFFGRETRSGGGSQNNNSSGKVDISKMNPTEMMKQGRK